MSERCDDQRRARFGEPRCDPNGGVGRAVGLANECGGTTDKFWELCYSMRFDDS